MNPLGWILIGCSDGALCLVTTSRRSGEAIECFCKALAKVTESDYANEVRRNGSGRGDFPPDTDSLLSQHCGYCIGQQVGDAVMHSQKCSRQRSPTCPKSEISTLALELLSAASSAHAGDASMPSRFGRTWRG